MITRRSFLEISAVAGAGLMLPRTLKALAATRRLTPFVDPLPIPPAIGLTGGGVIPLAMAPGVHQFHRDLPPTTAWGYGGAGYLGPTIVARRGTPITVEWVNNLPNVQLPDGYPLPIDTTLGWANPSGPGVPAVVHQHGGFTLPQFDGHPHQWFTHNSNETGSHYISNVFTYGNEQRAATLWYHDHAYGMDRLNVYMGLAAFYLLRDSDEDALGLPSGPFEVGLAIQDRIFNPDGSLFYSAPNNGLPPPNHPVWIPEFFGDTATVNGKVMPFLEVEPRRYRLRMLNGSNGRFYNFWFEVNNAPMPLYQIGTDQGFLGAAVRLTKLLLAPGERADVIFDFAGLPAGTLVTLMNNAKAPFPGGRGGSVPRIMQFRVALPLSSTDTTTPPAALALPAIDPLVQTGPTRDIMMTENINPATGEPIEVLLNNGHFDDPPTETPTEGATEVWQYINTTGDAHPMHTHLFAFQIRNRQAFDAKAYLAAFNATGVRPPLQPYLIGAPRPPAANEAGWKDTAQSYPGEVLRTTMRFDLPTYGQVELPPGHTNPEYVHHCHILEHEENDMMRPYTVTQTSATVAAG